MKVVTFWFCLGFFCCLIFTGSGKFPLCKKADYDPRVCEASTSSAAHSCPARRTVYSIKPTQNIILQWRCASRHLMLSGWLSCGRPEPQCITACKDYGKLIQNAFQVRSKSQFILFSKPLWSISFPATELKPPQRHGKISFPPFYIIRVLYWCSLSICDIFYNDDSSNLGVSCNLKFFISIST